jgi:hypothetical protein
MGRKFEPEAIDAGKYNTGISVAQAISALGWFVAVIGLFSLVMAAGNAGDGSGVGFLFLLPSLGTLIGGLLTVVSGEASQAIFHGANDARRILIISTEIRDEVNANPPLTE